jgi:hypothetical protein
MIWTNAKIYNNSVLIRTIFVDKILVSSFNNDLMLNLQQYDGRETVHRKSPSYNDVYNYIS